MEMWWLMVINRLSHINHTVWPIKPGRVVIEVIHIHNYIECSNGCFIASQLLHTEQLSLAIWPYVVFQLHLPQNWNCFHSNSQPIGAICCQHTWFLSYFNYTTKLTYTVFLNDSISLNVAHHWFSIGHDISILATTVFSYDVTEINTLINSLRLLCKWSISKISCDLLNC